ncbi:hypothetical protein CSC3H3_12730 [Thalassospira marina]|uniref:Uncharacterized protein n=1 Tax=Thalassospira marina TaxID=2048283 RepID=A0ABN5FIR0_9PROT|nr:hypothetical protein CSC3H3_12730 [Thalassospira marina]
MKDLGTIQAHFPGFNPAVFTKNRFALRIKHGLFVLLFPSFIGEDKAQAHQAWPARAAAGSTQAGS